MTTDPIDPMLQRINNEISTFIDRRLSAMPIEEQLYIASNSQMYSFWHELRDLLQNASFEIKTLKNRIKELENNNVKVS